MDQDRVEFRQMVVVLAGAGAGFAGTFLLPWSVTAAWASAVLLAAITLLVLRREDPVDESMALRLRMSFAFAFGFVIARLCAPIADWKWWIPVGSCGVVFVAARPWFPSRKQKERMARAYPADPSEPGQSAPVGRGWWFANYGLHGILISFCLQALRVWGWMGAVALFFALGFPMLPLRKLAKRREARIQAEKESGKPVGPLFPGGPT